MATPHYSLCLDPSASRRWARKPNVKEGHFVGIASAVFQSGCSIILTDKFKYRSLKSCPGSCLIEGVRPSYVKKQARDFLAI